MTVSCNDYRVIMRGFILKVEPSWSECFNDLSSSQACATSIVREY